MRSRWFHVPVLHTGFHHEKKVSWLELFFDLIFVAAIIQLGDALSHQVSEQHAMVGPFAAFAAVFVPLWVAWTGFTFYANRFDVDDFLHRLIVLMLMFTMGAMAVFGPEVIEGHHRDPFAVTVGIAQTLIALLHLRSYKHEPESRDYSALWGTVFAISAAFWFVSTALPTGLCYAAWALGVLVVLFSPIARRSRELTQRYPIDMEHLSERYGLLTIIVLGESFVKVLTYLSGSDYGTDIDSLSKALIALLITSCVWWIYFDDIAGSKVREDRGSWIIWLYGHLPLAISATGVGVALKKVVSFDFSQPATEEYRWLLCGALALTFISVAIIDSVTERRNSQLSDRTRVNVRFASAVLVLVLGQAGAGMSSGMFIAIITAMCVAQVIFDMVMAPLEEGGEVESISTAEIARRRLRGELHDKDRSAPKFGDTIRKGAPSELRRDLYFFFMEGSWTRLILVLVFLYLVVNIFFGALFMIEPGSISNSHDSFAEAFSFSVQTMSTIGYGTMSPATDYADLLVAIEAAVGILGVAVATGLMFAKASRPQASALFSNVMVVHERDGKPTLIFRVGNARGNEVVDATLSVTVLVDTLSKEGHHMRRLVDLPLVRRRTPLFTMSWTVMHVIDDKSPLRNVDWSDPARSVIAVVCTMVGHDSTYASQVHSRHTYMPEDIRLEHRFVDVISQLEGGLLMIDYSKFHDTEPVENLVAPEAVETDNAVVAETRNEAYVHTLKQALSDDVEDEGDDDAEDEENETEADPEAPDEPDRSA